MHRFPQSKARDPPAPAAPARRRYSPPPTKSAAPPPPAAPPTPLFAPAATRDPSRTNTWDRTGAAAGAGGALPRPVSSGELLRSAKPQSRGRREWPRGRRLSVVSGARPPPPPLLPSDPRCLFVMVLE